MPALQQDIFRRCQQNDRTAQKQLFQLLYAPLFRVCLRYLNHREDAEDCLMKGFLKAFQGIKKVEFNNDEAAMAWFRKIMANECLMFLRQKNRFLLFPEEEPVHEIQPADVLLKTDAVALETTISRLPLGYRTVFNLFAVEGFSHKEIAALLNITESTSKTQFSKAKAALKKMLELEKTNQHATLGK
jgi:RNA polymerase sigma factor (sigma-70 family)